MTKATDISATVTVLHIGPSMAPRRAQFFSLKFKKPESIRSFLFDKLEFILVSAFVFVISYLTLNYQAIYQNLEYKWKVSRGAKMPQFEILKDSGVSVKASVFSADQVKDTKPQQARTVSIGVSSDGSVGIPQLTLPIHPPDTRIVIPRILKNIPVIGVGNANLIARNWDALEKDIQEALRGGVVHYPGTALPGERGNVVITGHSSFYAWDAGRFKDVFGLLHEIKPQDKIFLFHNQKRYTYEVFDIRVVKPSEIDVLGQTNDERLTLITCTPLGTNLKRLIVTAKRVN